MNFSQQDKNFIRELLQTCSDEELVEIFPEVIEEVKDKITKLRIRKERVKGEYSNVRTTYD